MQEQKAYHQRKLAIIEMIEECEYRIKCENSFLNNEGNSWGLGFNNSRINIRRYRKLKQYLTERYNIN